MNDLSKKLPAHRFESGIWTADAIKGSMTHSFTQGKVRGSTTYFKAIDPCFSWKKGEVTAVTGWPQSGKSEFMFFLSLLKAVNEGTKWAIFPPENMGVDHEDKVTAGEIFDTLIHMLIGKSTDPRFENQMTLQEYEQGIDFIAKHYFVVYPEEDHKHEIINEYFNYLWLKHGIEGVIKDPWNSMTDEYGNREDQFLRHALAVENKFAKTRKIYDIIVAHPSGKPTVNGNGELERPNQWNLSGGNMWNNKCDNILSINRPFYLQDMADTTVDFHSLKIKKQKLVGVPGTVRLSYDRKSNRYFQNGYTPMTGIIKQNSVFDKIETAPF